MMTLKEKRILFTSLVPKLINKMIEAGYKPMIGRDGLKHMKNSLHFDGLAMDIDLCDKDGNYLRTTEAHKPFGDFWESLHELTYWGGDGIKKDSLKWDGNHYSITDAGRK
jgi:hypothetical protein